MQRWRSEIMAWGGIAALLVSGCAAPTRMLGANYLQARAVAMDSAQSHASLARLRHIGANTVALVPFLQQEAAASVTVRRMDHQVTDAQLRGGIRHAKALGLQVVIKPQILIPGSWAGEIAMGEESRWRQWFDHYGTALEHYADIAREEQADLLVIGTELNHTAQVSWWRPLIARIRQRFHGALTYAAHNVEGVRRFSHWDLLDSIALTLYPSLGDVPERDALASHIRLVAAELRALSRQYDKPFWIAEVGIPSRRGAHLKPWEWQEADLRDHPPDEALQAVALDLWLEALSDGWNPGILLWSWSSDPSDGGSHDTGFTLQNKRAEQTVACRWTGQCEPP